MKLPNESHIRKLVLDFFQRDGAYWIRITFVTDQGETFEETECDASRISLIMDGRHEKTDLN